MISDTLIEAEKKMQKAIEVLRRELSSIRTGRARPSLVEHLKVDYYGTPTPLNQIAGVSAPEARLLVIQPWDRQAIGTIEKAILKSDLGLTPTNDGTVLRLNIPQLTQERRKDLIKVVKKRVEEGRVAVRNVRREAAEELKEMEKNKEISEDEHKRALEQLQKLTDKMMEGVEQAGVEKEEELMEV